MKRGAYILREDGGQQLCGWHRRLMRRGQTGVMRVIGSSYHRHRLEELLYEDCDTARGTKGTGTE